MNTIATRQRFYVDGEPIELWEDPEVQLGCTPEEIRSYVQAGDWVHAFNALTLISAPVRCE
jgi:hypothetical protein